MTMIFISSINNTSTLYNWSLLDTPFECNICFCLRGQDDPNSQASETVTIMVFICVTDMSGFTLHDQSLSLSLLCAISLQWTLDCSEALTVSCLSPPTSISVWTSPPEFPSIYLEKHFRQPLMTSSASFIFRTHQWKSPPNSIVTLFRANPSSPLWAFSWFEITSATDNILFLYICVFAIFREAAGCSGAFQCLSK